MHLRTLLLATILGGIAIFMWGAISHALLPFYNNSLHRFADENAVTRVLIANTPTSGIYFMPSFPERTPGMSDDQYNTASHAAGEKMLQGPFMFASVRLGPAWMADSYICQVLTDLFTAFLIALILLKLSTRTYWSHVATCLLVALVAFALKSMPMWNWYSFSGAFTTAELIDILGRGLAGGLVMARFTSEK
jgi:hypothetical protein